MAFPELGSGHKSAELRARERTKLGRVSVEGGIDRQEATLIAQAYFVLYVSGCGGPDEPVKDGDSWTSVARVGYGGEPADRPIRITVSNGAITGPSSHSFETFDEFRNAISH